MSKNQLVKYYDAIKDFLFIGGAIHSKHYQRTIRDEKRISEIINEIEKNKLGVKQKYKVSAHR